MKSAKTDDKTATLIHALKCIGDYDLPKIVARALARYENEVSKEKVWQHVTESLPNCASCQAMKQRLVSIAKGCKSVEELKGEDEHDEHCIERDMILSEIYSIAVGKHNWPKAMPYDPITADDLSKI